MSFFIFQSLAATAVATIPAGYLYYQYLAPSKIITVEDPVTQNTAVPMLRAAAFLDAHGDQWEVQKSNMTPTIELESKKKATVELEILKLQTPFVVQQPDEVYAAYNADETAGSKRLFFSAAAHDAAKVTTNVPAMRLSAYVPGANPKQIVQHAVHLVLRKRWDKNYMAYDKAFIDESVQHPDLYTGVKEPEIPCGDQMQAAATIKELHALDAKQLTFNETTPMMVVPPSLRTPVAGQSQTDGQAPSATHIGLRRGFEPVHACWARHCVGSAALEKLKMRPREFLYEMVVTHKSIGTSATPPTPPISPPPPAKTSRWGRKPKDTKVSPTPAFSGPTTLGPNDIYSVVYQCLPHCLLPSSSLKLPPAPMDPFADATALMTMRLRTASTILSSIPALSFRTAPVQMHYQEMLLIPVWTNEDKQRYMEYSRTIGGSIQQDIPLVTPPSPDPITGTLPPSAGTFLIMTSCNDAQTPAGIPKWLMKSLAMSMASGAYNMLAEGIRTYEGAK